MANNWLDVIIMLIKTVIDHFNYSKDNLWKFYKADLTLNIRNC